MTKKEAKIIVFICLFVAGAIVGIALVEALYGSPLALSIIAVILSAVAIGVAAEVYDSKEN